MKCERCNSQRGSARCEDCGTLYCLPCLTIHHSELSKSFQELVDIRNEVQEICNLAQSLVRSQKLSYNLNEINQWENEMIDNVRKTATRARNQVVTATNASLVSIRSQMEELSQCMQNKEKEGSYLEKDIEQLKNQLQYIQKEIGQMAEKVRVKTSTNIDWNSLIEITPYFIAAQSPGTEEQSPTTPSPDTTCTPLIVYSEPKSPSIPSLPKSPEF